MKQGTTVLAEIPGDYEPSEEEVTDYAKWLGIDTAQEQSLMWIAREGIKAPLPQGWKACKSSSGDIYYFNFETSESMWEHPLDNKYRQLCRREREKARTAS
ncbi:hypothetical protein GUITHDRAFT_152144 [Guillardia theta CCMP2712]|uniref:WW domain-containing protein n=1 Tax=Guillardia theta (strain CCMP2712) TaxID=905079 RepID=L1JEY4_GUITC|nr:hypothetical protein GUITHDRAFT_152144 [Guillardia theta CCMP2712]EKX47061.1 hypothetical protein GUITHDRAFT_152144 [Guillardia theta CCMP2712]|eukprot:XP_005834041.1 hypothetical protein GUITHDRAFT_152144 [Guillardia theta CCMP2712]